jgi:hypothetical protein
MRYSSIHRSPIGLILASLSSARVSVLPACALLTLGACATFDPVPLDEVPFRVRAVTKVEDNVRVSTVVLSEEESEQIFGRDLYARGIQPVWLEIENNDESGMRFLPVGLDPEYFAPLEVSYMKRFRWAKFANEKMDEYFFRMAMGEHIPAGSTRSGFVFSQLEHGTKVYNVDVMGKDHDLRTFTFFVNVPGLKPDYQKVNWANLYPDSEIVDHDRESLRQSLRELPCCVTDDDGGDKGLALNVVFVGHQQDVLYALVRSGWDATGETVRPRGKSKPISGVEERYRPVSIRYVFDREQDKSFRKSRHGIHPRTHLRLWMTPMRRDGVAVWVGQVGRDFEMKPASATHAMDADEARISLMQDLMYSQSLARFGYVRRLDDNLKPALRETLTDAPYYADGYRLVLVVSSEPVAFDEMENLGWDVPPWE